MIFSRTPFRMSFFGGGTDMAEFYNEYGGAVISSTFDKYCYVNVRHLPRFFEHKNQLTYSKIEKVNSPEEFQHPLVREGMKYLDMHELIISYDADLPARTGLGTSSSFAVGMLNSFYALKGKYVSKRQLADDAIYLERVLCKENGGIQDQIAVSYGGFNRIDMDADGYKVSPIIIHPERKELLNDNLMLFFSGFSRLSSQIHAENKCDKNEKIKKLLEMKDLVNLAEAVLTNKHGDLDEFGRLLDHSWQLKMGTGTNISNNEIDYMYKTAKDAGALGGKLLGAGGGGFMLFYVPQENQAAVKKALEKYLYVKFKFENAGTEIIYYAPEEFTPETER